MFKLMTEKRADPGGSWLTTLLSSSMPQFVMTVVFGLIVKAPTVTKKKCECMIGLQKVTITIIMHNCTCLDTLLCVL